MREIQTAPRGLESFVGGSRQLLRYRRCGVAGAAVWVALSCVACGGEAASGSVLAGSGRFSLEGDFVALEKGDPVVAANSRAPGASDRVALVGLPASNADFYLAVKRSALSERWFLSAYMKQFYPGNAGSLGDGSFGTRVVSFEVRNDRLMMFDASDRFKASEVGDPQLLIEAYPIVAAPEFDALPGAADYVIIDPSRGLNEFSVSGNTYADPYLPPQIGSIPLRVGLSFTQNFQRLPDGASFEEVFTGDVGPDTIDVWGTLGVTLRRYTEGEGYVPTADPGVPYYFTSDPRLVPDSGGAIAADPIRWNFRPGMPPVQFFVSAGARRAQADNPDADLLGALRRGIEGWNDVLGYRALEAVFADDDEIRGDDESAFIVDYPGENLGFAFASWRTNPNTGEVRGGSVYMSGVFFDFSFFEPPPEEEQLPGNEASGPKPFEPSPLGPTFGWGGLATGGHLCDLEALSKRAEHRSNDEDPPLTANQQGERYIQHVTAHEVGHLLGLRHNFKGALLPPTSSVMEYAVDTDSVAAPEPGEYDIAAIHYLYQQSSELPTQPFCTDEDTALDPLCVRFDSGADPLRDWFLPRTTAVIDAVFDQGLPVETLELVNINALLGYARDGVDSSFVPVDDRSEALRIALGRASVPLDGADAATPTAVEAANTVAEYIIRRVALDPIELRGDIVFDVSDPGVISTLAEQSGRMLRNEDGVRSFALRRTAVDVLHGLQSEVALVALAESLEVLKSQRWNGEVSPNELPIQNDLIARTEAALDPYFE
jgi:hypothetical protein